MSYNKMYLLAQCLEIEMGEPFVLKRTVSTSNEAGPELHDDYLMGSNGTPMEFVLTKEGIINRHGKKKIMIELMTQLLQGVYDVESVWKMPKKKTLYYYIGAGCKVKSKKWVGVEDDDIDAYNFGLYNVYMTKEAAEKGVINMVNFYSRLSL